MRALLAGLLVLLSTSGAFAQASGQVLSIGFADHIRNDCWPAMLVQLHSESNDTQNVEIRVTSKDLDGDEPYYSKVVTLTAKETQACWMYFLPQPTKGGLPSATDGGRLKDLQDALKVGLYTTGGKFICNLPLTSMVSDIDRTQSPRGTQFILVLTDGISVPSGLDDYKFARGLLQDVVAVPISSRDLPENELGYQAVDIVLWSSATPLDPAKQGEEPKLRALDNWVRQGGHLVILQTAQWQQTAATFGPMLPVDFPIAGDSAPFVGGVVDRTDSGPLRWLANPEVDRTKPDDLPRQWRDGSFPGPFKVAKARQRPTAIVEDWLEWKSADGAILRTPYLARQPYGLGAVTWVAQDLGDGSVARPRREGWPKIWDRVFDWKNEIWIPPPGTNPDRPDEPYGRANSAADSGAVIPPGTEHDARSSSLVFLAVLFFIFYWIAAGPGSYLFLAGRRRTALSWFIYALSALAATGLTVLIVHFVLRGPPQIKHITLVRTAPGEPAIVDARIGLYIPRDGPQTITLKDTAHGAVSHIEPYGLPPKYATDSGFTARMDYRVPVRDIATSRDPGTRDPELTVRDYRSTLKKFQARWIGDVGGISGQATLLKDDPWLAGRLANDTGHDLVDVYVAFAAPGLADARRKGLAHQDRVVYIPRWAKSTSLDLQEVLVKGNENGPTARLGSSAPRALPGSGRVVYDYLTFATASLREGGGWEHYWTAPLRSTSMVPTDIVPRDLSGAFVMASLFSRLPPVSDFGKKNDRIELLRRGARYMDISPAVAAGNLVVLARAQDVDENTRAKPTPLPFPLEVNGSRVEGEGIVLYQAVIPVDRTVERPPLVEPAPVEAAPSAGQPGV